MKEKKNGELWSCSRHFSFSLKPTVGWSTVKLHKKKIKSPLWKPTLYLEGHVAIEEQRWIITGVASQGKVQMEKIWGFECCWHFPKGLFTPRTYLLMLVVMMGCHRGTRCYLLITGPCSDPGPRTHGHGGHSAATERQRGGHQKQISPFNNSKSQKGSFPHELLRWYCDTADNEYRSVRMELPVTSPVSHWFVCLCHDGAHFGVAPSLWFQHIWSLLVISTIIIISLAVIFNAITITVVYTWNDPRECTQYLTVLEQSACWKLLHQHEA